MGMNVPKMSVAVNHKEQPVFYRTRIGFFLFALLVFGGAVYYSATLEKDIKLFEKVTWYWLGLALLGQCLTYGFAAMVYRTLLQLFHQHQLLSLGTLFRATLVAQFLNQVIPSAGISGNAYMLRLLGQNHVPPARGLSLVVLELLAFYAAIELMIVFALVTGTFFFHLPGYFHLILALGFGVYLLFAIGVTLAGRKKAMEWLHRKLSRLSWAKKMLRKLEITLLKGGSPAALLSPVYYFRKQSGILLRVVGWQAGIYLADALTIFSLFRGLSAPLPMASVFIGLVLTRIITVLPIAPGALILFESSMTFFYVSFGAPLQTALVVTLLYRVLSFWMPMPIGFLMYRRRQQIEKM